MNKIVYSFWIPSLKNYWQGRKITFNFDTFLKAAINCLTLSVLYAKKNGFYCELVTDRTTYNLVRELPFDRITTELTLIEDSRLSWVKGKILTMMLQKEPFVHLHWDVLLDKTNIVNRIKDCNQDVLTLKVYEGNEFLNKNRDIIDYSMSVDLSDHFVRDFHTPYFKAFDCSIVGFNDLKLRDRYVGDFFKCLDVANKNPKMYVSSIIEEYLLFVVASREKKKVQTILQESDKEDFLKNNYTQLLSLHNHPKVIQNYFESKIRSTFPRWNFLIKPKEAIKNKIKISLCTVVMNRKHQLMRTLRNNVRVANHFDDIDINILNYNSTDGLEAELFSKDWFTDAIKSGKLKYYRNTKARYYHRSLPKNKIHDLSKGEYMINIDADNFVSKKYLNFCLYHINNTRKKFFIRSSLTGGSYGRIMVHRKDFEKLQGYNLKMRFYGFEDTDFCLRLKALRIHQILCPEHLCTDVIEHGDELRVANEPKNKHNKNAYLAKQRSDAENRSLGFQLYPNKNLKLFCEVESLNHLKEVIQI